MMFVDESLRQAPKGLYLLAAAVFLPTAADSVRDEMRHLIPRGQGRFHWHRENEDLRMRMLAYLAGAAMEPARFYVARPIKNSGKAGDRARAKCLERLLWDVRDIETPVTLVIESRQRHNDHKDAKTIANARWKWSPSNRPGYRHCRPETEPLLWAADALAGAASAHLAGHANRYFEAIPAERVFVTEVEV